MTDTAAWLGPIWQFLLLACALLTSGQLDCECSPIINSSISNREERQWRPASIRVTVWNQQQGDAARGRDRHQLVMSGYYAAGRGPPAAQMQLGSVGKLVKVLSLGLCREDTGQLHHEPWIGLVRPKESDWYAPSRCNRLAEQALRAAKRGAVGLVFDARNAHWHLRQQLSLDQLPPEAESSLGTANITLAMLDSAESASLDWLEALDLTRFHGEVTIAPAAAVSKGFPLGQGTAAAGDWSGGGPGSQQVHREAMAKFYAEIAAFLLFFLAFCITGIVLLVKFYSSTSTSTSSATTSRRRHGVNDTAAASASAEETAEASSSQTQKATRTIVDQLGTRLYRVPSLSTSAASSWRGGSTSSSHQELLQRHKRQHQQQPSEERACAVCLEEFNAGEQLRVLPCRHQYHPGCVDPWLLDESPTCPLCMRSVHAPLAQRQRQPASSSSAAAAASVSDAYSAVGSGDGDPTGGSSFTIVDEDFDDDNDPNNDEEAESGHVIRVARRQPSKETTL